MKHSIIAICMLSIAAISCNNADTKTVTTTGSTDTSSASVDKKETAATTAPVLDSATKMKNWMAYSAPSEMHKMMASWDGRWDNEVSMWHAPGMEPEKSKMVSTNKMIMGGRYQVSTNNGNMMGMPFEGTSTLAYDNAKKEFISTWIDNMGTGIMVLKGPWNATTKTIDLRGMMVSPEQGDGTEVPFRQTIQVIDDNTQLFTMYGPGPDGKETKMMEIKANRK